TWQSAASGVVSHFRFAVGVPPTWHCVEQLLAASSGLTLLTNIVRFLQPVTVPPSAEPVFGSTSEKTTLTRSPAAKFGMSSVPGPSAALEPENTVSSRPEKLSTGSGIGLSC